MRSRIEHTRSSIVSCRKVSLSVLVLLAGCALGIAATSRADTVDGTSPLAKEEVPAYLDRVRCIACHGMAEMRVGPPWVAIAARYRGADRDQLSALAAKIRIGGSGNWGTIPMIPNPQVNERDAEAIVQWLMSLNSMEGQ